VISCHSLSRKIVFKSVDVDLNVCSRYDIR